MAPPDALMAPPIPPLRAAYDALQCMGLGLLAAMLRCLFPVRRGRLHFFSDFFCTGAALILLQAFAASRSGAGTLRWYMFLGLAAGAAAGESVLVPCRRILLAALAAPFRFAARKLLVPMGTVLRNTAKRIKLHKKNPKIPSENRKKQLQKQGTVLYNSNV